MDENGMGYPLRTNDLAKNHGMSGLAVWDSLPTYLHTCIYVHAYIICTRAGSMKGGYRQPQRAPSPKSILAPSIPQPPTFGCFCPPVPCE